MNAERIMDALGNIDDRYIANPFPQKKAVSVLAARKKRRFALLALLAAALLGCAAFFLANTPPSLTLAVYAMDETGTVAERLMPERSPLPVSLITADDGTKGFLFSLPMEDASTTVGILAVDGTLLESMAVKTITRMTLAPGRTYYFLVGNELETIQEASFFHRQSADHLFRIHVTIERTENGFLARWESATQPLGSSK